MRIFLRILSNPGLSFYALVPEYLFTREDRGMTSNMNGFSAPVSELFSDLLSDVGEFL